MGSVLDVRCLFPPVRVSQRQLWCMVGCTRVAIRGFFVMITLYLLHKLFYLLSSHFTCYYHLRCDSGFFCYVPCLPQKKRCPRWRCFHTHPHVAQCAIISPFLFPAPQKKLACPPASPRMLNFGVASGRLPQPRRAWITTRNPRSANSFTIVTIP